MKLMKYYRLYIDTDGRAETYNSITKILDLKPLKFENTKDSDNQFSLWAYEIQEGDNNPYFDFIHEFLNILEPKFLDLEKLGILKDNILLWLLYEYDQQCAMEFHPKEMKRLGDSGIHLNIDCWQKYNEEDTSK